METQGVHDRGNGIAAAGNTLKRGDPKVLRRNFNALVCTLALLAIWNFVPARAAGTGGAAQDLRSALAAAYGADPRLESARARLAGVDETLAIAQSGYRPKVDATGELAWKTTVILPENGNNGDTLSQNYGVQLSQNVFDGFQTSSAVSAAKYEIAASRSDLKSVELDVLLDAVRSFSNVAFGRKVVALRELTAASLTKEVIGTRRRLELGELVVADLSTATARAAQAESNVHAAQANLAASEAEYARIVGEAPGPLAQPVPLRQGLPGSLAEAIELARARHPSVAAAEARVGAASSEIDRLSGKLLPQVSLSLGYDAAQDPSVSIDSQENVTVAGRMRMPLFDGGEVSAQIRRAKQLRQVARAEHTRVLLLVISQAKRSWSRIEAARAELRAGQAQAEAGELALTGLRRERELGQRSLLEVLDAEQIAVDGRVAAATSQRDLVIATYELLAAVGRLDVAELGLPIEAYDPATNYETANGRVLGNEIAAVTTGAGNPKAFIAGKGWALDPQ